MGGMIRTGNALSGGEGAEGEVINVEGGDG